MGSLLEDVEPRIEKMFLLLKNEVTIFERLMYKNANQHRRALYFRRLCQMLDPILNASLHIAGLLGLTFFMPFALTVFSILARLRVLLSQCLHDVVHVFNLFSTGVSEQKHFNHKSDKLPASLECKWDGMKMVLTATFTNHEQDVDAENEGLVEDGNGRKYSIYGSLVSAQVAMELEGAVEIMPSADVTWEASRDEVSGASVMAPRGADKNSDTQNSKEKRDVGDQELYKEDKAEEFSDSAIVPKRKVAYVSVESASSSRQAEKRKEREMHPPPKREKKDTLFDMLLGLGDEMPKTLF